MKINLLRYDILVWLSVFFLLFLSLTVLLPSLIWDEVVYLSNAKSMFFGSNYAESFRSPILSFFIGLIWILTGEQVIVAKIIIIIFTLGCVYLTFKIGKGYFGEKSIFLTILFSLSPLIVYWGTKIYTDIPSLFFILLSFHLIKEGNFFFSGISTGLGFLARYSAFLFGLSVFIFLIWKKRYKELVIFTLTLTLCLIPWMIYNQIEYKNPFYDVLSQMKLAGEWTKPYKQPAHDQILNLLYVLGPFLVFLPFGIRNFIKKEERNLIFIYIILFFIYFAFFYNLKLTRYYIMVIPFLYFLIFEGLSSSWKKIKYKTMLNFFVVVSCIILLIPTFSKYYTDNLHWKMLERSIMYVKDNVSSEDTIISNFWPYFGYFTDSECISPWTDLDYLIKTYDPKYIIYHERFGLEMTVNQTWAPEKIFSNKLGTIFIYKIF